MPLRNGGTHAFVPWVHGIRYVGDKSQQVSKDRHLWGHHCRNCGQDNRLKLFEFNLKHHTTRFRQAKGRGRKEGGQILLETLKLISLPLLKTGAKPTLKQADQVLAHMHSCFCSPFSARGLAETMR